MTTLIYIWTQIRKWCIKVKESDETYIPSLSPTNRPFIPR